MTTLFAKAGGVSINRGNLNTLFESQLSRMNCQTFSCECNSGHLAVKA